MNRTLRNAYFTLVYGFLYLPIAVLIAYSFNASKYSTSWGGFSLRWYDKLFGNELLLDAALNSLLVATLSATGATLIGALGAVALYRYRFRGRTSLSALLYIVMMAPDIVMGISLLLLFVVLHVSLGLWSLLLAHVTLCLPFVVVTVNSRLAGFDAKVVEAARDLGASEAQAFYRVILPMILPAVAAGWLLSFTLSLDDVVIAFFVTGPTFEILPLKIYSMVRLGVKPEVNALCTLILALSLGLVLIAQYLLREKR